MAFCCNWTSTAAWASHACIPLIWIDLCVCDYHHQLELHRHPATYKDQHAPPSRATASFIGLQLQSSTCFHLSFNPISRSKMATTAAGRRESLVYGARKASIVSVQNRSIVDHEDGMEKPVPIVEKADWSGAHEKTDPKEIALVRKLDRWIMVSRAWPFLYGCITDSSPANAMEYVLVELSRPQCDCPGSIERS